MMWRSVRMEYGWLPLVGDQTARVWDVGTGQKIATLNHDNPVTKVTFSLDGKRVASASLDQTARVWEVETGQKIATLNHDDNVTDVAFSSDGKWLVSASWDQAARVHWLFSNDLAEEVCQRLSRNLSAIEWKSYMQTDFTNYSLACENLPVHPTLLTEAQKLSEAGEVRKATTLYRHLLKVSKKIEPPLDLDPWTKDKVEQDPKAMAKRFASGIGIVRDAERFAQDGAIEEAIKRYQRALRLNPEIDLNPATAEVEHDPEAVAKAIAEAAEKQ